MLANMISSAVSGRTDPLSNFWYQPVGGVSSSGIAVTDSVALSVSTVFACIRVLADSLGILPCHVYERLGDDKKRRATDHEFYTPLHSSPNLWQTPIEWRSMGVNHLGLRGNFYSEIVPPGGLSDDLQLVPRHPDRMKVEQMPSGRLRYTHTAEDGIPRPLDQDQVLHVKLMPLNGDGLVGGTPIAFARDVIGIVRARRDMNAKLYRGGGFIKYYLKTSKRLGEAGRTNFRKGWRDIHGYDTTSYTPPILEDDMDLKTLGMNSEELQFIESEKLSAIEICQFFGVPPHLVHLLDRSTFSNIEQQGIEFKTLHLAPYAVRFEQAAQKKFADPKRFYVEFLMDGLLRGDTESRYKAHGSALGGRPFMTLNEVRAKENLEPVEGGDEIAEPLNMQVPGQAGKQNRDTSKENTKRIDVSPLAKSAADRIVSREVKGLGARADKATGDRVKFDKWASTWWSDHITYVIAQVQPIAECCAADVSVEAWADSYVMSAMNELKAGDVVSCLVNWNESKAETVAAQIEELCNV